MVEASPRIMLLKKLVKFEKQTHFLTQLTTHLQNSLSYDMAEAKHQGTVSYFKKTHPFSVLQGD